MLACICGGILESLGLLLFGLFAFIADRWDARRIIEKKKSHSCCSCNHKGGNNE